VQSGSVLKRKLFEAAYAYKRAAIQRGDLSGGALGPFFDRLVFSKVQDRIGGEASVASLRAAAGLPATPGQPTFRVRLP
jgi:long-chain acyl-CoA synthetase